MRKLPSLTNKHFYWWGFLIFALLPQNLLGIVIKDNRVQKILGQIEIGRGISLANNTLFSNCFSPSIKSNRTLF